MSVPTPSAPVSTAQRLDDLASQVLNGTPISQQQALSLLQVDDAELMALVAAAGRLRRHFFGTQVQLNYLISMKTGLCPEDCFYCSQRLGSQADVLKYSWLSDEDALRAAEVGIQAGAKRVCLVSSGRGPSNREVERVAGVVEQLKATHPDIEVCACLGQLKAEQADRLAKVGTDAYNHNFNTAESNYPNVCTTHDYSDRVATVEHARQHGMQACSGFIAGLGESDEQLVEVAFALREAGADSVPVNFLMPFDGTPMQGYDELTPQRCLKILALVRFVHPDKDVRVAAGREMHLRTLQPLMLEICNSLFLGDYPTSEGQAGDADLAMIADAGFTVLGADQQLGQHDRLNVPIRRRGAGTGAPANA